jgi:Methyltransferase small domain
VFSVRSATVAAIREKLLTSGYTESRILKILDVEKLPGDRLRRQNIPLYRSSDCNQSALSVFVRLFLLGEIISVDDVRSAILPTDIKDWAGAGLLKLQNRSVAATVELWPCENLNVAADWPDEAEADLNQVMGIAASSRTLAQATVRRHSKATLDLGAGSGILSLLAAAHSEHVVALDSNPRAIALSQLNARLNDVANIEFLEGNLFEPVSDKRFDLIVCNPPFVIAPERIYLHSHSGMPLDRFCEAVVRTAPDFLTEGGYFQMVCNWVQPVGENWQTRLASWSDRSGCDAWILHSHSEAVAEYASNRIANLPLSAEQRQKRFDSWMRYYNSEQIEAIGFGLITMHRSSKKSNWFRCDPWPEMIGACGDAIERGFAARDFLEAHDDHELLETHVRRAPNLEWRPEHDIADLALSGRSTLQLRSGLAYSTDADPAIVSFVSRCAGDRPLAEHLNEVAAASGEDPTHFAPRFLAVVRRLLERGFLVSARRD